MLAAYPTDVSAIFNFCSYLQPFRQPETVCYPVSMTSTPATLKRRLAALIYESLLVGAVTVLAALFAGVLNTFAQRMLPAAVVMLPLLTMLILIGSWWYYFKLNWLRENQTLPMRVWNIALAAKNGGQPNLNLLRLRFGWACVFTVFIPALAYAAMRHWQIPPRTAATAALFWWILPWGFALLNPRRQFLYDYLAGTELVDNQSVRTKQG